MTTGVHNMEDVLKSLMAGASVTMMASELLKNGLGRIGEITDGMQKWMEEREYVSVTQMKGSMSAQSLGHAHTLKRSNYIKTLNSFRYLP